MTWEQVPVVRTVGCQNARRLAQKQKLLSAQCGKVRAYQTTFPVIAATAIPIIGQAMKVCRSSMQLDSILLGRLPISRRISSQRLT